MSFLYSFHDISKHFKSKSNFELNYQFIHKFSAHEEAYKKVYVVKSFFTNSQAGDRSRENNL